jgi:hypothetical protein
MYVYITSVGSVGASHKHITKEPSTSIIPVRVSPKQLVTVTSCGQIPVFVIIYVSQFEHNVVVVVVVLVLEVVDEVVVVVDTGLGVLTITLPSNAQSRLVVDVLVVVGSGGKTRVVVEVVVCGSTSAAKASISHPPLIPE